MADPLERLTNLLAVLLETKVPLSLERIFHNMPGQYPTETSARRGAFERDKVVLRSQGIPLQQTILADGGTGYWIDRDAYELGDLGLTEDEKRALQLAVAAVRLGVDWGDDALLKIGGPDGSFEATDVTAALPSLPALAPLFDAHLSRATTTFRYRGKQRQFDPWGLLSREGFWYVVGLEHAAGERRTFRVDRIESDVEVGHRASFTVPDGFDPATAVMDDPKAIGEATGTSAMVLVGSLRAQRVENEVGAGNVDERRTDGSILVRVPCANVGAFRSWLFGLGDHAEVLSPPEVRAEIVAWLEHMAGAA
jgi:proteasome accessory factor B